MQKIQHYLFIIICFGVLFGCTKSDAPNPSNSSRTFDVEGFITGDNGTPIQNAVVKAGTTQVSTDVNGHFFLNDAVFTTSETFITATAPGYFRGSRTFNPRANSNNFVRIELLSKIQVANINSQTGGTASVGNMSVVFPSNAFTTADGSDYSGTVSVKAAYIDPTSPDMSTQMPGDLRGLSSSGSMRGLKSFGMGNIELETPSGAPLKIKNGSSAELSFSIPASLTSQADPTIPLWYFDEGAGIWKEEGNAQKVGNVYKGAVTHFTFWNVDEPFEYTNIEMRVVNSSSTGIQNALVQLSSLTDSSAAFDYTDSEGYVQGYVPINTTLKREIFNECNELVYSDIIGPFSTNTNTGNVIINNPGTLQTITGTVTNCSGLPIASGSVVISVQGNTLYTNVLNGSYSVTFARCSGLAVNATVTAIDPATQQQGSATVALTTPVVTVVPVQACGTSTQEFVTVTVNNDTRTWTNNNFYSLFGEEGGNPGGISQLFIVAYNDSTGGAVDITLNRWEDSTNVPFGVGIESISIFDELATNNMLGDYYLHEIIQPAVLTEWGPSGQMIVGSFSGYFIRNLAPISDTVTLTASFRVRRS